MSETSEKSTEFRRNANLWIATQGICIARNDGGICHFEPLQKGDPTGCKAQATAKKSIKFKAHSKFMDCHEFALAQTLTMTGKICGIFWRVC